MTHRARRQRLALASLVGLLTMYAAEQHAYAGTAASGHVTVISKGVGTARLLFTAVGLPSGATIDPSSVHVTVDGEVTDASATIAGSTASATVARRVVLVVDTSGSMAGAGITGARAASLAFAESVPPDVRVGLVTFANRPHIVLVPTLSRSALKVAVNHLKARGETSLYDGVRAGLHLLGQHGERGVVVLSDGADTRSRNSLAEVTGQLQRAGVRMDAVALHTADAVTASLESMTRATGGRVTATASAAELASAFSAAARTIASQVVLNISLPATDHARTANIRVAVSTSVGLLQASTTLPVNGSSPAITTSSATTSPHAANGTPLTLLALAFAGMFVPLLILLIGLETRRTPLARTKRLLGRYTLKRSTADETSTASGLSRATAGLMAVADRVAANPARRDKLVARLSRADVSLTPGEWLAVQAISAFTAGVLGTLLFGSVLAGLVLGGVGVASSSAWLSMKGRRRLRAFEEHLPSALQLVASSLRSGFSLDQALDGVVREGVEPIAGEFNRALGEARLGKNIEDALDGISERMTSNDFSWVVMAIRIQREVGGNLAEILLNTVVVMRDRARLRRQVKALSAEGRLSAYVLIGLPLSMAFYMFTLRRAYIKPLYTTGMGVGLLSVAILLLVTGTLWMRKIVTVEA